MAKLKISNLHKGDIIKDYETMCELIDDEKIPSKPMSKRNIQYKKWKRYFDFSRDKAKFIINNIYDKPILIEDSKASKRVSHGGFEKWCELNEYVEHKVLGFSEKESMPLKYRLRLEGLSKGNFIANNNIKPMAEYQYEDILTAIKVAEILIKDKSFDNLDHKFNYIMAIVESKVNDVVLAKRRNEKQIEKVQNIDISNQFSEKAEYKPKSKNTTSKILDNLW